MPLEEFSGDGTAIVNMGVGQTLTLWTIAQAGEFEVRIEKKITLAEIRDNEVVLMIETTEEEVPA